MSIVCMYVYGYMYVLTHKLSLSHTHTRSHTHTHTHTHTRGQSAGNLQASSGNLPASDVDVLAFIHNDKIEKLGLLAQKSRANAEMSEV
jgi:hypothetical protein